MTQRLPNFISGQWQAGTGAGTPLFDPILGTELVSVDATGLDLAAGFAFAREQGGAALRALTYRDAAQLHTGHGNVMPQSLHGGPGRAGGGEELGGLRALNFYHRRSAIQASTVVLSALSDSAA